MNCPNCGHAAPPTNAARCGHCNFKLPVNPKPQAAGPGTTLPCWNCRHPNAAEVERCGHCNAKLQITAYAGNLAQKAGCAPYAAHNPETL